MKKLLKIIYVCIFLAVLLIPLLLTDHRRDVVSDLDNRKLAEMPQVGEDGFGWKFEKYMEDRIGLRTEMLTEYAILHDALAGELIHPSYMYGKDGYVFVDIHNNIQYGDYHKRFAEMVWKVQQYCEARGAKFYFVFDPEKASVMREYLPEGINYDDSWVEEMLDYMKELGVNCINNKAYLIQVNKNAAVFNKKYDAYHWNDIGCLYGTNNLLGRIHQDFPEVTELSDIHMDEQLQRFLPQSRFRINEQVPYYQGTQQYEDLSELYLGKIKVNPLFPHFKYLRNISDQAGKLPEVLMFQGSYYIENKRGERFLPDRFSEYVSVHNYQNILDLDYYFNIFQPEIVVFEVAEYTLSDYFFDSEKMLSLNWNPALDLEAVKVVKTESSEETMMTVERLGTIDLVSLKRNKKRGEAVYLLNGSACYDLIAVENGDRMEAIVPEIKNKEDLVIIVCDSDGAVQRIIPSVTVQKRLIEELTVTSGVTERGETFDFQTNIPGNEFDAVELLMIDEKNNLQVIKVMWEEGRCEGSFVHGRGNGWYTLRLVANSNLSDEYIDMKVWLEDGKQYGYIFTVDLLDKKEAIVSDYRILMETEDE